MSLNSFESYPHIFFEGAEKLLEIWFLYEKETSHKDGIPDLRNIPGEEIDHILDLAKCEVLKKCCNEHQIAFVLSESSLFITNNRIILKTCGKTSLLSTLEPLIYFSFQLGFSDYAIYYSRPSYIYPEFQPTPHNDFEDEIKFIQPLCANGSAYTFGESAGDSWHFYCGNSKHESSTEPPGQTFELFMRDLNPRKMMAFHSEYVKSNEESSKLSGIADLFPKSKMDSYLFKPCGFSINGLMDKDSYFTIHVTPEADFSYASFETNVELPCYLNLMVRVLDIFEPNSFICTFFSETSSPSFTAHSILEKTENLVRHRRIELRTAVLRGDRRLTFLRFIHKNLSI